MKRALFVVLALASLAGCADKSMVLRDAHGNTAECNGEGIGLVPMMMAENAYNQCVSAHEAAGYRPIGPSTQAAAK